MKNIIVPIDFSDTALNALKVAAAIAAKNNSTLHLVHVYERPIYGFVSLYVDSVKNTQMRKRINEEIANLAENDFLKGVALKKHLLTDIEIWEMIKDEKLKDADLIVMGSHGCSGWKEYLIGSNTEKVVRLANCPVLVIKEKHDKFKVNNMVFASNFYGEVDAVFNKIKKLAVIFDTTVHLLKVNTPNLFEKTHHSKKVMEDFAEKFKLKNYTTNIYNDSTVEDGILNFSETVDADIIAMTTHGRTGITHLINGSLTEDVVNHIPRPVLSVKIKEEPIEYGVIFPGK